ncbi:OmpA family protein [Oceaniovalibus sp. ACAM 378]|uniref:OmpA family protein n=1 Tax=Oceaniovalibus sp. ACAM 378 TaxID=2599923 RepID=UPI001CA3057D|nr:OmpA family protein [Oceaniovalibus sp. ACAM 378]
MKISNIVSTAAAGALALGLSVSAAAAETCVIALPFDFGSAAVSTTNQGLLDIVRSKYNGTTVDLAGYTDAVGSPASNLVLSQRRAKTVSDYLTSGTTISVNNVTGFGESNLKVADTGPNQLNRRVEVTVYDCNAADFDAVPIGAGLLGGAGVAAGILGAVIIVGAIGGGDGDGGTGTGTGTGTATGTGN